MAVPSPTRPSRPSQGDTLQRVRHMPGGSPEDPAGDAARRGIVYLTFFTANQALTAFGKLHENVCDSTPEKVISNNKYLCRYCGGVYLGRYKNLLDHLDRQKCTHFRPNVVGKSRQFVDLRKELTPYMAKPDKDMTESIRQAWADVISETGVPFAFVESPALRKLLALVQPREAIYSTIPTPASLSNAMKEKEMYSRLELNKSMRGKWLTLALNEWKISDNGTRTLGLIYYLPDGTPLLFNVEDVSTDDANGNGVAAAAGSEKIEKYLKVEAAEAVVGAVIADSAGSFKCARQSLDQKCPNVVLLPCFADQMNLIIRDVYQKITWVKKLVENSKRLTSFLQAPSRLQPLKEQRARLGVPVHKFVPMVPGRWSSVFHMLSPIVQQSAGIENALDYIRMTGTDKGEQEEAEALFRFVTSASYSNDLLTAYALFEKLAKLQDHLQQNSARLREVLPSVHEAYEAIITKCMMGKGSVQKSEWHTEEEYQVYSRQLLRLEISELIRVGNNRITKFWDLEVLAVASFLDPMCDKSIFSKSMSEEFVKGALDRCYARFFGEARPLDKEHYLFCLDRRYFRPAFEEAMQPLTRGSHTAFWKEHMQGPSIPHIAKLGEQLEKIAVNTVAVERMFSPMGWLWACRRRRIDHRKVLSMVQQQSLYHLRSIAPSGLCLFDSDDIRPMLLNLPLVDEVRRDATASGAKTNEELTVIEGGMEYELSLSKGTNDENSSRESSWDAISESCPAIHNYGVTEIFDLSAAWPH